MYSSLFNLSPESKLTIEIACESGEHLPNSQLADFLDEAISSEEIKDLLLNTRFPSSETPGYDQGIASNSIKLTRAVMPTVFCKVVSPFSEYLTFQCGIPFFVVEGFVQEWHNLAKACLELADLIEPRDFHTYLKAYQLIQLLLTLQRKFHE